MRDERDERATGTRACDSEASRRWRPNKEWSAELADVATRRFVDELTVPEIAKKTGKTQAEVRRMIRQATRWGVVSFSIDERLAYRGRPVKNLEKELNENFGTTAMNVVEVDRVSSNSFTQDNYVHTVLANMAALEIKGRIEAETHIALGGGRAAYETARALSRMVRPYSDVQITPLCGRIRTHSWQNPALPKKPIFRRAQDRNDTEITSLRRPLDADDAAVKLFSAFEYASGTRVNQVSHPLFAETNLEAERHMTNHCPFLPRGQWRGNEKPQLAILGVGQMDPNGDHRLAEAIRDPNKAHEDLYLDKAIPALTKVIEIVKTGSLPYPGDLSNRLFPALFLPEEINSQFKERSTEQSYESLVDQLEEMNRRMVVIDWGHLRGVKTVVIAGGEFKRQALWTLLLTNLIGYTELGRERLVYELWTDAETAKSLLRNWALLESRVDGHELWDWYVEMSKKLFVMTSKAMKSVAC